MPLTKLFLVFVTLVGEICSAKMMIIPIDPNGIVPLENAAVQIITTCYANYDKTIVILGDDSGNFIKKLSLRASFSLVLLDRKRRTDTYVDHWYDDANQEWNKRNINRKRNVHIVVTMVTDYRRLLEMITTFRRSPYRSAEVYLLILGWSPKNNYALCNRPYAIFTLLYMANINDLLNVNVICRDRSKGIVLYGSNSFTNWAPEPWRLVESRKRSESEHKLSYFVRQYSEYDEMCKNLYFDKTHDLGGSTITTVETCDRVGFDCSGKPVFKQNKSTVWLQEKKHFDFIDYFISYINATRKYVWINAVKGEETPDQPEGILSRPSHMMGMIDGTTHTPVHGKECVLLISQFRGNKSQLKKITSVIDSYSWVGIYIVCFITLIIFKYFLRQQLIVGMMNVYRLICNCGITGEPSDIPSRIYLGCLLFFVITMQGIFTGNLAALLTHDIPVRQVNSIVDVAEFDYNVYTPKSYYNLFEDPVFKGRVIVTLENDNCMQNVERDHLSACVAWTADQKMLAIQSNFYIGRNCIASTYIVTILPWKWPLEERLQKFLGIVIGGSILMVFEALVYEVRTLESESEDIPLDPVIITLRNLAFVFTIYGIGLGCAIITFIVEVMIYQHQHRVTTTRVIILK